METALLIPVVSLCMFTQEFVSCCLKPKRALSRQPLSYNGERFMGKNSSFQSGFHKIILNDLKSLLRSTYCSAVNAELDTHRKPTMVERTFPFLLILLKAASKLCFAPLQGI